MIRCAIPRGSRTAQWLTTVNRTYTSSKSSSNNGSSTKTASAREQVASTGGAGNGNDSNDPVGREDGSTPRPKAYKPRDLPLSPFMDPKAISARDKHHALKSPPSKTPTLFQQQLAKNPYAQALATPVRSCEVTHFRLPNYFLQDFQLMAHPGSNEPWWVPTSLRKKHGDTEGVRSQKGTSSLTAEKDSPAPVQTQECDTKTLSPLEMDLAPPSPSTLQPSTPSLGPGVYTLSRQTLLSSMQHKQAGWSYPAWKYFQSSSTKRSKIAIKVRNHSHWRIDMDSFILELMRRRIVEGLVYLVRRKRGYVSGCVDWDDAKIAGRQQAMILWTGKLKGFEDEVKHGVEQQSIVVEDKQQSSALEDQQQPDVVETEQQPSESGSPEQDQQSDEPPAFATLTLGKDKPHMVPVHNLPMLLGLQHLAELRRKCPIFDKKILIVRHKRTTIDIQMKLWRLQGYLGVPYVNVPRHFERYEVETEDSASVDSVEWDDTAHRRRRGRRKEWAVDAPEREFWSGRGKRRPVRDDFTDDRVRNRRAEEKESATNVQEDDRRNRGEP